VTLLSLNPSLKVLNDHQIPESHRRLGLDPQIRSWFLRRLREGDVIADVAKKIALDPTTGDQIVLARDPKDVVERRIAALKQRRRMAETERYSPKELVFEEDLGETRIA
jgi:hypothetical protein